MEDSWLARWNNRYSDVDYAYGELPNAYFKKQLKNLKQGKVLFAAEGEGRNAVYAATQGWEVHAFDISTEGKKKAQMLAEIHGVQLQYQIGELPVLNFEEQQFDAIVLIFAHFPSSLKSSYHQLLLKLLKNGGVIIFEAFSKKHLPYRLKNEKVGGPADLDSLFSEEELIADFQNCVFTSFEEKVIVLNEGIYHQGEGSVIHFAAKKKN